MGRSARPCADLKRRGKVVTSSRTLIVWLPKRRLEWLETREVKSRETVEEITRLAEAVRTPTGLPDCVAFAG